VRIVGIEEIRGSLVYSEIVEVMRAAVIAYSRGECDTPMPMHLAIEPEAEVHIKSSSRRGGKYFALKTAATFPGNATRNLPVGGGMMLLSSAETGEPVAFLADGGHLTDVRTAAVASMVARELGRSDRALGIVGTGIQARLQASLHAAVLPIERIALWGRTPERTEQCRRDLQALLPRIEVAVAGTPSDVARAARLIVTCTASRAPLLAAADLAHDTHISAVGADSPGKQELDSEILRRAALLLADSRRQCEKLGELQHAPDQWARAVEIGKFCERGAVAAAGPTVCDFTGLGAEDLYIAESVWEKLK